MPTPETGSKIKGIALLGAGIFAKEAHLPALAALGASAPPLLAVYSRSSASARALAAAAKETLPPHPSHPSIPSGAPDVYFDVDSSTQSANNNNDGNLDALLAREDVGAVIVLLPITVQPDIVRRALKAGKHVLSEKPVAPDVASGIELIEEYRKGLQMYSFNKDGDGDGNGHGEESKSKHLVWRVAENFEAEPAYHRVAERVRKGDVGEVRWVKSSVWNFVDAGSKYYKTPWRTVPEYQGGFLLDGGVHTAAMLRVILPTPPTHLTGFAALNKAILAPHDTIHSVLKAVGKDKDGKETTLYTGTSDMTFASPTETRPPGDALVIAGTTGWLSVNTTYTASGPVIRVRTVRRVKKGTKDAVANGDNKGDKDGDDKDEEQEDVEDVTETPGNGVQAELEAFFAAVQQAENGEKALDNLGDPSGALWDVAFIEAALKSDGRLVDLGKLLESGEA